MDYFSIGANLRIARQRCGLTQEALAEKANIGANFLGKIERGTSVPSLDTLLKLANALESSMDTLLYPQLTVYASALPLQIQSMVASMLPQHRAEFLDLISVIATHYLNQK